jgi:cell division septal protein FtsQ
MASWDPRISITHILITGNSQLEKEIVQNEVRHIILRNGDEMVSPNTTFTVNIRLIESELRYQFPQLKTVSVSRHLLNTLRVSITDRAEYFVWCVDTTQAACYATDETGYIFKRRPSRDDFYVSGGIRGEPLRQTLSRNTLASILATKEHLPKMHVTPIHIAVSDDNTQLSIQLAEGPYILFPITKDPEKNISLVQNVFSSEHVTDRLSSLAYIDVRFGNRVFLKPHEHITETEEIAQELEE